MSTRGVPLPQHAQPENHGQNQHLALSANGRNSLIRREGVIQHYYNDIANNCTFGVGTLVHAGSCTPQELQAHVTNAQIAASMQQGIQRAEAAVRRHVTRHALTQQQFDSLVSFVYNTGEHGALTVLAAANRGQYVQVAQEMARNVYIHPRDARGRPLPPVRSAGLVHRRFEEAMPFRSQQPGQNAGQNPAPNQRSGR